MSRGVIHWFRKGLRLHDNPAFMSAIKSNLTLYPVFMLDPWFVKNARVGVNRWRFLQETLTDLDQQLRKLGSRLIVVRGKPDVEFPELFVKWNIKLLSYEVDTEPYSRLRDGKVNEIAAEHKVEISKHVSHTLYDVTKIIAKNKGSVPLTYQKLQSLVSSLGPPLKSLEAPTCIPKDCLMTKETLCNEQYNVPTLEELGVKEAELKSCLYPGGECEGLKRLDQYICKENKKWVSEFEKPKTPPNSLEPSTTVLSPYLKFGCVSPRLMYERLQLVLKSAGKHTQPPVSLYGQLLWREFFYTCGYAVENFSQMKGNTICRQIDWDTNNEYLSAWRKSQTGYPYIDAIMTQLRDEGWIHHLARHSVACFLTRGDLYISWEEGMKVFEEYLLDADWSLNAANWMWLSASAFFHQYFRVYSPVVFGKKTDPRGLYIKKYLPALKKFPEKYIYEPWEAPLDVQKRAGCIIGKDYPRPVVDHSKISKINIGRMKAAYDKNKAKTTTATATVAAATTSSNKKSSSSTTTAAAATTSSNKKSSSSTSSSVRGKRKSESSLSGDATADNSTTQLGSKKQKNMKNENTIQKAFQNAKNTTNSKTSRNSSVV